MEMTSPPVTSPTSIQQGSFTYDPEFKGIIKKRSCTDIICLFVLVSFLAGWAVIAFFAFRHGNPNKLVYPTDSHGNICGVNNLTSKPYLYFFNILECADPSVVLNGCPTTQVCVSQCPNETFVVKSDASNIESFKDKLICKYDVDMKRSVKELIEKEECASIYLRTKPLLRRCIPNSIDFKPNGDVIDSFTNDTINIKGGKMTKDVLEKATKFLAYFYNANNIGEDLFSDFKHTWKYILGLLCLAMIAALIWIVLMRWISGIMIWTGIIGSISLAAYALYYSVTRYSAMAKLPKKSQGTVFTLNLASYTNNTYTWLTLAIISGCLLAVLLIVIIFLRKRIHIAIALIKEGSKAVGAMPLTLLFPIFPYLIQLMNWAFWISVTLYLASASSSVFVIDDKNNKTENRVCDPHKFNTSSNSMAKCIFQTYKISSRVNEAQAYNFFAFLWCLFFLSGLAQLALAYAFSSYYWTFHKNKDVKSFAIISGFNCAIRFHLGSIALGSFLLATMKYIRALLEYSNTLLKKYDNPVTSAILCCMKCCFYLLEKFLQYISRNAYIMIAAFGENFCTSAKMAFSLLLRNILRATILDTVTEFLLFVGKMTLVCGAAVGSFYVFTSKKFETEVRYYPFPIAIVTIGAYFITHVFFSVYGMAVDTLFLCFLQDLERNDGSPEKPYYMSKELMKILNKANKYREPALVAKEQ